MEDEYSGLIEAFYEIYRPLQKKHNLRLHEHFDIYDDGLIEIWKHEKEDKRTYICRVKEESPAECYRKAIEELKAWAEMKGVQEEWTIYRFGSATA